MSGFSICMIVKNEAENIARCLDALRPLQSEIVVCDTGSTDNTPDIARGHGARVVTFDWTEDFSAARNFVVSEASEDLILAVDADEYLTEYDLNVVSGLAELHPDAVGMIERISPTVRNGAGQSLRERVGRFYNRTRFHYEGTIHENISPIDSGRSLTYYELPLTFLHGGYETPEKITEKAHRDLAMLLEALQTEGDTPYLNYQTGKCYVALQQKDRAIGYYEKALAMQPDMRLSYVQDMVESCGYCLLETGQAEKAMTFLLSQPDHFSARADFCFLLGLVYMNNARFPEAIERFRQATTCKVCAVDGCDSYRAYYNIGVIYEVLGDLSEAHAWYRKCGQFAPALARLGYSQ